MNVLDALVEFGDACALFPGPIEFAGAGIPTTKDAPEWIRMETSTVDPAVFRERYEPIGCECGRRSWRTVAARLP